MHKWMRLQKYWANSTDKPDLLKPMLSQRLLALETHISQIRFTKENKLHQIQTTMTLMKLLPPNTSPKSHVPARSDLELRVPNTPCPCLSQNCFLLLEYSSISPHLCPKSKASFNAKANIPSCYGSPSHLLHYHTMLLWSLSLRRWALWVWGLCPCCLYSPGLACGRHVTNADWIKVRMEWKRSVKINTKLKAMGVGEGSQRELRPDP